MCRLLVVISLLSHPQASHRGAGGPSVGPEAAIRQGEQSVAEELGCSGRHEPRRCCIHIPGTGTSCCCSPGNNIRNVKNTDGSILCGQPGWDALPAASPQVPNPTSQNLGTPGPSEAISELVPSNPESPGGCKKPQHASRASVSLPVSGCSPQAWLCRLCTLSVSQTPAVSLCLSCKTTELPEKGPGSILQHLSSPQARAAA